MPPHLTSWLPASQQGLYFLELPACKEWDPPPLWLTGRYGHMYWLLGTSQEGSAGCSVVLKELHFLAALSFTSSQL